MQRLQNMRMPRPLQLAPVSLFWLSVACGGDGGAVAGGTQPATQETQSAAVAGSGSQTPAQSSTDKSAAKEPAKAPAQQAATKTATSGAAGSVSGSSSATSSAANGGGAGAPASQSPDAPAAAAGSGATEPAQAAAGSGGASATQAAAGASGGAAGAAGPVSMPTEDGIDPLNPDWSKRTDLGKGEGADVVTIGDSWMDYIGGGGGIQAGLDRAGTSYRHYALSGTTLLSGQIPGQYTRAKGAGADIKTVIMTGGGNDVMFSGGCNTAELCEESVARIQEGLNVLWTEMADDGVKDVIYIGYSEDAGTTPTSTRPKETKPVPICLTGRILCHNVQTTELVMGQLVDGIHPTASANDRIAAAVLKMMEERKMRR